jgi:hypothetical protein
LKEEQKFVSSTISFGLIFRRIYITVNLYNQELCIITEFSVIMYNY